MALARAASPSDCNTAYWLFSRGHDGSEESGDFVDSIRLDDGRRALIAGDIAGRGKAASPLSRRLRTYVRAAVFEHPRLDDVVRAADHFVSRQTESDPSTFATLFLAVVDENRGTIVYTSAGHETALVLGAGLLPTYLATTGSVLGLGLNEFCGEREILLSDQTTLVVVSDGITDAREPQTASFFGASGVALAANEALFRHRDVAYAIFHAAEVHASGNLLDDASVVAARICTRQNEQSLG